MAAQCLEFSSPLELECEEMAKLDVLEERVNNHILGFKWAIGVIIAWMAWITVLLYQTKSTVGGIAQLQANAPAQIAAAILSRPVASREEAQSNLSAVSAVLQTRPKSAAKVTLPILKPVSDKLVEAEHKYPDLPQVWQTTGIFINYKSDVLLANASAVLSSASGHLCEFTLGSKEGAGWVFKDCEASLEEIAYRINGTKMNGFPATFTFINCVINYHGGALPDGPLLFSNSVFRFYVTIVPSRRGTDVMRLIAESESLNRIQIPS